MADEQNNLLGPGGLPKPSDKPEQFIDVEAMMAFESTGKVIAPESDLHRSVSRMAAGLIIFHEAHTKGDVRRTADRFATEVIEIVHADLREQVQALKRVQRHVWGLGDTWVNLDDVLALLVGDDS